DHELLADHGADRRARLRVGRDARAGRGGVAAVGSGAAAATGGEEGGGDREEDRDLAHVGSVEPPERGLSGEALQELGEALTSCSRDAKDRLTASLRAAPGE